jgi:hypothetical protein
MITLSLQLPESLHQQLKSVAEREGVSIDQFIATAVADKLSALMIDDPQPTTVVPGWGNVVDPLGDCQITGDETSLRIDVPGTLHELSIERGQIEAPRVLRRIEKDFVAEVTVVSGVAPGGERTSQYVLPYHGTGLLVWLDRNHYIRFERAAILRGRKVFHYLNLERRANARATDSCGEGVRDGEIALRLECRDSKITASYRLEGQGWVRLSRTLSVQGWGPSLLVGVAAVNTSTEPFHAELREFRVITIAE